MSAQNEIPPQSLPVYLSKDDETVYQVLEGILSQVETKVIQVTPKEMGTIKLPRIAVEQFDIFSCQSGRFSYELIPSYRKNINFNNRGKFFKRKSFSLHSFANEIQLRKKIKLELKPNAVCGPVQFSLQANILDPFQPLNPTSNDLFGPNAKRILKQAKKNEQGRKVIPYSQKKMAETTMIKPNYTVVDRAISSTMNISIASQNILLGHMRNRIQAYGTFDETMCSCCLDVKFKNSKDDKTTGNSSVKCIDHPIQSVISIHNYNSEPGWLNFVSNIKFLDVNPKQEKQIPFDSFKGQTSFDAIENNGNTSPNLFYPRQVEENETLDQLKLFPELDSSNMLGQQFNQPIINLSSGQLIKISEMNSCGPNAVKWNPWSWKRNFDTMEKGVLAKKNILETPGVYPPQIVSQLKLVETSDALVPDLDQNSITNVNKIDTLVTDNLPINVPDVSNEEPCEVSPTILQDNSLELMQSSQMVYSFEKSKAYMVTSSTPTDILSDNIMEDYQLALPLEQVTSFELCDSHENSPTINMGNIVAKSELNMFGEKSTDQSCEEMDEFERDTQEIFLTLTQYASTNDVQVPEEIISNHTKETPENKDSSKHISQDNNIHVDAKTNDMLTPKYTTEDSSISYNDPSFIEAFSMLIPPTQFKDHEVPESGENIERYIAEPSDLQVPQCLSSDEENSSQEVLDNDGLLNYDADATKQDFYARLHSVKAPPTLYRVQPMKTCNKPRRVGLSRYQKVQSLHF